MDPYQEALHQAVRALPRGSKRLKSGKARSIANAYGRTVSEVRRDVEKIARKRNRGEVV